MKTRPRGNRVDELLSRPPPKNGQTENAASARAARRVSLRPSGGDLRVLARMIYIHVLSDQWSDCLPFHAHSALQLAAVDVHRTHTHTVASHHRRRRPASAARHYPRLPPSVLSPALEATQAREHSPQACRHTHHAHHLPATQQRGAPRLAAQHGAMAVTLDDLVLQLHQLLPICGRNVYGPCLEEAGPGGRGWAVYPANEKVCTSDILLPGFNMLPRWLLGGGWKEG